MDVLYVAEPVVDDDGQPLVGNDKAIAIAIRLAAEMTRICSAHTVAGTIWEVDAALRPEGKSGQLVRTLDSHRVYYSKWAKTWEFQAMLKARPSAGDLELGAEFVALLAPLVWTAAERENFVADTQAMRKRVVEHIPARNAGRELKLGEGGLRDVEFSVQLLQLVHGRVDERLRVRATLPALKALVDYGYVGRNDGKSLAVSYRFLRTLEHRISCSTCVGPMSSPTTRTTCAGWGARWATATRRRSCCPPGGTPLRPSAGCTSGCSTHRCWTPWPSSDASSG